MSSEPSLCTAAPTCATPALCAERAVVERAEIALRYRQRGEEISMEDNGLLRRALYNERPPRVEYVLTDKGKSLGPLVRAIRDWGTRHS